MADIPKVIKNFNLFADGRGYAGKVDEVTLPDLALVIEEQRGGGLDGPIPLDFGMEMMEASFVMPEHNPDILSLWGIQNGNGAALIFRAAMVDDIEVVPYIVKMSGMFSTVSPGTIATGQKSPLTVTAQLRFFELSIGPREIFHIDLPNMIRRVNGVDVLAAQRSAIGV